jgi:hypothetical protein
MLKARDPLTSRLLDFSILERGRLIWHGSLTVCWLMSTVLFPPCGHPLPTKLHPVLCFS